MGHSALPSSNSVKRGQNPGGADSPARPYEPGLRVRGDREPPNRGLPPLLRPPTGLLPAGGGPGGPPPASPRASLFSPFSHFPFFGRPGAPPPPSHPKRP